uniref:Uncharacterized protein n=1 Tax=Opuntia streptacantha TaxID=393608 RepID=A0A7C8ZGV5_OPUST
MLSYGILGTRRRKPWLILEMKSTSICCVWRLLQLRSPSHSSLAKNGEAGKKYLLFPQVTAAVSLILGKFSCVAEGCQHPLYRFFSKCRLSSLLEFIAGHHSSWWDRIFSFTQFPHLALIFVP